MAWRIMQLMETHEIVRAPNYNGGSQDFPDAASACDWIDANEDQFPESEFWPEHIPGTAP